MPLPDSLKVLYRRSPLLEVTSQLVFPPILKIDAELPVEFQESVRKDFPFYEQRPPDNQPPKSGAGMMVTLGQGPPTDAPSHVFDSIDRKWRIKLTRKSLSLVSQSYTRWEDFRRRQAALADALAKIYSPAFYSHVCLRYRNMIRRESLQLQGVPWSALIESWVCGPLGQQDMAAGVESVFNKWLIKFPEKGVHVEATTGLADEQPSKLKVFIIETHTYTNEQTGVSDVLQRLDGINQYAGQFFRLCITERLHMALDPAPVG